MNKNVEFPQVVAVHDAESDKVAPAADSQLLADPSLVVFNAFPLNDEACGYFGGCETIGYKGQDVPFTVRKLE